MILKRLFCFLLNIFMPPLSVIVIAGLDDGYGDVLLNLCFFLLAIFPSHIHAFYLSQTYYHRAKKVKNGRYPGGYKPMIFSRRVLNGGASDAEVARLAKLERGISDGGYAEKLSPQRSGRSSSSVSSMQQGVVMRKSSTGSNTSNTLGPRRGSYTNHPSQRTSYVQPQRPVSVTPMTVPPQPRISGTGTPQGSRPHSFTSPQAYQQAMHQRHSQQLALIQSAPQPRPYSYQQPRQQAYLEPFMGGVA